MSALNDSTVIEMLIGILMAMVGAFYASFIREIRLLRTNAHELRNTVTHHEFRLITLERLNKLPEYEYPKEHER